MIVGVPTETLPGERRVAMAPDTVKGLARAGVTVHIQAGAGERAGYTDAEFKARGAEIVADRAEVFARADVVAQVNTYGTNPTAGKADLDLMREGQIVIGFADPLSAPDRVAELAARKVTAFGMELIPRITRAQSMDALSSMAMLAGYRAALLAATRLPRCFPMFMTAAGTIKPARVFVIGAGVAGLQAIATCKRLGAVIHGYDVRPEVEDQVVSVGGKFVKLELETRDAGDAGGYAKEQSAEFLEKQRALMAKVVADSTVVITTAAIPGKKAPILVTEDMVKSMEPGSVIVDLAAERGGNCPLTRAGQDVEAHGVTILGPVNIAASVPYHASQMYANNVQSFLKLMVKDGKLAMDLEDEIIAGTLMCKDGEVVHPRLRDLLTPKKPVKPAAQAGDDAKPAATQAAPAADDAKQAPAADDDKAPSGGGRAEGEQPAGPGNNPGDN